MKKHSLIAALVASVFALFSATAFADDMAMSGDKMDSSKAQAKAHKAQAKGHAKKAKASAGMMSN
ncbi:MAG: hypothetical protein QG673_644 [Pseudomonadota bacterium]|nr:hypothetical protein [Pseudomonadota bacterium]